MADSGIIEEQGFAIIPGVFPAEFLDQAMDKIWRLAPARSRAGVRHALHLEPVAKIARCRQLIGLAAAVLGPAAFPLPRDSI